MAAIERDQAAYLKLIIWTFLLFALVVPSAIRADPSAEARAQVSAVAEALSSSDAAAAMTHFAKSLPAYDKVKNYFEGLAAFQVENELEITYEEEADNGVTLTITWGLTLTDLGTDRSRRRTEEIHVKVARINSKWCIVEFAPFDIFNPQLR